MFQNLNSFHSMCYPDNLRTVMDISKLQKQLEEEHKALDQKFKFISDLQALMKKHGQTTESLKEILGESVEAAPKKRGRPRKHVPTPTTLKESELPNRKSGKKAGGKSGKTVSKKGSEASSKKKKKPHWHVEWSRSQIMCRTGETGPNTTMRILFGPGQISYKAAEKMANTWLKKQLKARGLS